MDLWVEDIKQVIECGDLVARWSDHQRMARCEGCGGKLKVDALIVAKTLLFRKWDAKQGKG